MRKISQAEACCRQAPKGCKLCLLSVRTQKGFAGWYEPGLIARQAFGSGRQNLLSVDFEGGVECFFMEDKDAKTGKRKAGKCSEFF